MKHQPKSPLFISINETLDIDVQNNLISPSKSPESISPINTSFSNTIIGVLSDSSISANSEDACPRESLSEPTFYTTKNPLPIDELISVDDELIIENTTTIPSPNIDSPQEIFRPIPIRQYTLLFSAPLKENLEPLNQKNDGPSPRDPIKSALKIAPSNTI